MAFRRMWSGFSSEIETYTVLAQKVSVHRVACGAASHLRLKRAFSVDIGMSPTSSHVERLLI